MARSIVLLFTALLLLASCSYTRDNAIEPRDLEDGQASAAGNDSANDSSSGEGLAVPGAEGGGGQVGDLPLALVEIPSKGDADAPVVEIEGENSSFSVTFGELDEVVQTTLANSDYRGIGRVEEAFDIQVLNLLLLQKVVDQRAAALGVEPSEENIQEATETSSEELANLLAQQAAVDAGEVPAQAAPGQPAPEPNPPTDEQQEEAAKLVEEVPYYQIQVDFQSKIIALTNAYAEQLGDQDDVPCVNVIVLDDEEKANELSGELIEDPSTFADVAMTESLDQQSGQAGGSVGCINTDLFPNRGLADAIDNAEVGVPTAPVSDDTPSQTGQPQTAYYIFLISEYQPEEIEPEAYGSREVRVQLQQGLTDVEVTVDENIGVWNEQSRQVTPLPE